MMGHQLTGAIIVGGIAIAIAMGGVNPALAQSWQPTRAVEVISSTGAGGAQDRLARTLQAIMQTGKLILAPIVVVNKPGGSGTLSVVYLNRTIGDGHALLVTSSLMLSNHIMGLSTVNYSDMSAIAQLFREYPVLAVRADSPLWNANDFIAKIKAAPDSVSVGVTVLGTAHHISIAQAAKSAGVDPKRLKMVIFKAGGDALVATMGGHIDASVSSASNILPFLANGTMRAIAISAPQRLSGSLAKVATWKENGVDSVSSNFRIVFGPRGLSESQISYWENILLKVTESEAWKKQIEDNAWVGGFHGNMQTRQLLSQEYGAIKGVLTDLGMAKQ